VWNLFDARHYTKITAENTSFSRFLAVAEKRVLAAGSAAVEAIQKRATLYPQNPHKLLNFHNLVL